MINELLEYQQIDEKLKKIELEIAGSEERKKTRQAKKFLESVDENADKIDKRAEELIGCYQRISNNYDEQVKVLTEYEAIVDTCDSGDELNYLKKKSTKLMDEIKTLEVEMNRLKDEVKELILSFNDLKKKTGEAKKQYMEFREKYNDLKKSYESQMLEIKNELDEKAKSVDKDLLDKYMKAREDKIFPILYPVANDRCGYCRMELSGLDKSRLADKKIIECEQCRRIIYIND